VLTLWPGKSDNFHKVAQRLEIPVLGELPLVEGVSASADRGSSYLLNNLATVEAADGAGGLAWRSNIAQAAEQVAASLWNM